MARRNMYQLFKAMIMKGYYWRTVDQRSKYVSTNIDTGPGIRGNSCIRIVFRTLDGTVMNDLQPIEEMIRVFSPVSTQKYVNSPSWHSKNHDSAVE